VESVIDRIKKGNFWKFHGGIHPPEQKFLTSDKPIRNLPIPEQLVLPLQQHIGQAGTLLVTIGEDVLKGQALTQSSHPMAVPIHAPTSGRVTDIKNAVIAHPSGLCELCLFLEPDNKDQWQQRHICPDFTQLTDQDILTKIADAGIAGMGGAGFPTHVKVNNSNKINYLIINAAECEPYITADDLLIREHCATILDGIKILNHLLKPIHILIGIEDNKPEAIKTLQQASQAIAHIQVCVLPTKYPSGGEKQLIKVLTGKEITSGTLPSSQGIVMQNVATCYAIADAVINDVPLIKRVVSVSGKGLGKPQNVWALLGTPVSYLLSQCDYQNSQHKQIIMGGPMMGFALPTDQVPIVKTSNCILAPDEEEISSKTKEVECIRCGQCADVCPAQLLPQELQWSAKAKDQQQLNKLNLFDCIECGACAYVCPSQIPLVHYYRVAKAEIRQQQQLDITAEKAKLRFEARKIRLERDKKAREEKHKKAAAARKAKMNSDSPVANTEKSAVAAALARVKAKKAQANAQLSRVETSTESDLNTTENDDKKTQVAAAIARAKAKKLAQKENSQTSEHANVKPTDDKKSKVAAAVAKAKAKKIKETSLELESDSTSIENENEKDVPSTDNTLSKNDKKAKVAAAVAKAKAKKIKESNLELKSDSTSIENEKEKEKEKEKDVASTDNTLPKNDKKAKVAAAVAKAKAKKIKETPLQAESDPTSVKNENEKDIASTDNAISENDKKSKIAAAVAKAKARKLASKVVEPVAEPMNVSIETTNTKKTNDDKKSRVAAAVAKAKAKKQQRSESI